MIYIVLGMHKSGTTLVSQILHHSGINMGENIDPSVSYDRGNKYERLSTRALNLEILGLEDVFTPSVDPKVPDPLPLTAQQRMRMRKIIQECNRDYRDWGFKDPRTCLVYPLWASELPEHRLIAVFRPHTEVWPHYRRNGLYRYYQNIPRVWRFTRGWYRHQLNVLAYLEKTDMGFLVLNYHKLLTSDLELNRLEKFVGVKLKDRRRQDLYRNRSKGDVLLQIATWLVQREMGHTPKQILDQFEALRHAEPPTVVESLTVE